MGQDSAVQSRAQREQDKVERYRRLARELESACHELRDDQGFVTVWAAADELRRQAAEIARRLDR